MRGAEMITRGDNVAANEPRDIIKNNYSHGKKLLFLLSCTAVAPVNRTSSSDVSEPFTGKISLCIQVSNVLINITQREETFWGMKAFSSCIHLGMWLLSKQPSCQQRFERFPKTLKSHRSWGRAMQIQHGETHEVNISCSPCSFLLLMYGFSQTKLFYEVWSSDRRVLMIRILH